MARRHPDDVHENHDRWMVSYADFITLLLAFFVVLYSISSVNEKKYEQLSEILEGIFNVENRSVRPIQLGEVTKQNERTEDLAIADPQARSMAIDSSDGYGQSQQSGELQEIADRFEMEFFQLIKDEQINISGNEEWAEISLSSALLFKSGSAILNESADPMLYEIAVILREYPNAINIEGFTDNIPIGGTQFASNWELSASRAATVVRMMVLGGVEPSRLAAVGYGEFQPIASNLDAAGREKNRRVVIVVAKTALQGRTSRTAAP